jgi:iron(III) transport system ATP-binding protein
VELTEGEQPITLPCQLADGVALGAETVVSIRPENVQAMRDKANGARIEGEVQQVIFLGNCVDCRVRWGEFEWKVLAHPRMRLQEGERVYLRLNPEHTLAVRP